MNSQVTSTKRQGIVHLQQMKPEYFVEWMRSVDADLTGVLRDIKAVMKIDGLGARFGKDANGRVFFEGSRTGPIFEPGAFSAYAMSKTDNVEIIDRANHYDQMLEVFRTSSFMDAIPNNTKVVCEIFYNPMGEIDDTGIKFVTVRYDRSKLGDLMTIMPYSVLDATTGMNHEKEQDIKDELYSQSNQNIKVIDPNLQFTEIDISGFASAAAAISKKSLGILKSRKHKDREAKRDLISMIQDIKDKVADKLLSDPGIKGKYKLGKEIEGIVLHIPTGDKGVLPYKITTNAFKKAHTKGK